MEMCKKLSCLYIYIGTLAKRNSDKHVSSGRSHTKRQSGKGALKVTAKSEKCVLLMY